MKKILNIILVISLFILIPLICVGCKNEPENTITITFDSNGGDEIKSIEIKPGGKISKPKDINKKGFLSMGGIIMMKNGILSVLSQQKICA